MGKKQGLIKDEFKPLIIGFIIILAFLPIIVILSMITDNGIIQTFILSSESILMGILFIVTDFRTERKREGNYDKCIGVINKAPMGMSGSYKWSRFPIIFYEVDGKAYKIKSDVGYGGIASFFLKGKKVTVYYDLNNPSIAYTKNYILLIVGVMLISVGSIMLVSLF